ncbi:nuclear transcription factor Y subunit B-6 [Amaranthus tricolor]|uniref:nuclear transcription factor Y subunit B-6 n=1 Tax=Amaranthus tricolor TaxID=29722 RepID=UPI002584486D|nr:nuclear transcription factor Y subunit B-6 [Amaranthus tricolor]
MDHHHHRGGFHGYRKQHPLSKSSSSEMRLTSEVLPAEMNHIRPTSNGKGVSHDMNNHTNNHHPYNNNNNNNNGFGNGNNNHSTSTDQDNNECTVREQDRFMPIANVIRIMRKILPPHAKISDDAKETIQECVSEYISFITGEANERCQREQRKTITAEDVLWAMSKLGFDDYIEPLTLYLHRYRELEGERGSIRTCEPLLKLSRAAMDQYAAFGPVFHIGPPPTHHPGYYGGPSSVNGYLKEATAVAGSDTNAHSQPSAVAATGGGSANSVASFEPYGQHK